MKKRRVLEGVHRPGGGARPPRAVGRCQSVEVRSSRAGATTNGCVEKRRARTARSERSGRRIGPGEARRRCRAARGRRAAGAAPCGTRTTPPRRASRSARRARRRRSADAEREQEAAPLTRPACRLRESVRGRAWPVEQRPTAQRHELERLERPRGRGRSARGAPVECRRPLREIDSLRWRERRTRTQGVSLAIAESVVERLRAAVESTGATGFGAFAGLLPARRAAPARRLDGQRSGTKLDARARERGRLRGLRRRPGRALHQRRDHDRRASRSSCSTTSPRTASTLEQVAELVDGAAEVCRAAGLRAARRRDGRAARRLPRGASSTSPARASGIVERDRADRRLPRSRPATSSLGLPSAGRARERLHARPARARGRATTTADLLAPHTALPRRRARGCARAPTCRRSRT